MTLLSIPLLQFQEILLIFLRVIAIIASTPVLDSKNVPAVFKIGMGFAFSFMLYPLVHVDTAAFEDDLIPFFVGAVSEVLMGVSIGLTVRLIFTGVQLAGQLAGFQMGFAIANVMDSVSQAQISMTAQIKNILGMLIFLSVNGHYHVLRIMVESFDLVPLFGFHVNNSLIEFLMKLTGAMFVIAVKVGAPIVVALLLTSVALGLAARTVPQMNIFVVAFPIKIAIGLLFMALSLPYVVTFLQQIYGNLGITLHALLRQGM